MYRSNLIYFYPEKGGNLMKSYRHLAETTIALIAFTAATFATPAAPKATADSIFIKAAVESLSSMATGRHGLAPEIAGKLSGDQLLKAMKDLQEFRLQEKALAHKAKGGPELLIPIIAVGGFFTTVTLVVLIPLFLQFRRNRLMHETLRAMVDKGMEIPPALLSVTQKPKSDLRSGIIGVSVGIGICAFFLALHGHGMGGSNPWAIGLIPLFIGIGYIVVWKLESKKGANGSRDS
jgi:hypothetical protein